MSIDSIPATTAATFIYDGYYRARGDVSFAERAAWGLCSPVKDVPQATVRTRVRIASRTVQNSNFSAQIAAHQTSVRGRLHLPHDRPGRVWKTAGHAHAFSKEALTLRWHKRPALQAARPWRRYTLKVVDRAITVLIANGKCFISVQRRGGCI